LYAAPTTDSTARTNAPGASAEMTSDETTSWKPNAIESAPAAK
jgi:hypothetical protein